MRKRNKMIKKVNKSIKYCVYKNYDKKGYDVDETQLKINPIPCYIDKCYVNLDGLKFKVYLLNKDIKTLKFRLRNQKSMYQLDYNANLLAILIGMKIATLDYIRGLNDKQ